MNIGDYRKYETAETLINKDSHFRMLKKFREGKAWFCQKCYSPLSMDRYSGGRVYLPCKICDKVVIKPS